jgi:epsilon-lactone hydrolase
MTSLQMLQFLNICPRMPKIPTREDLPARRALSAARTKEAYPPVPGVAMERVTCDGVAADWFRVADGRRSGPVVLYIHGGAFIWSSPEGHAGLISRLAVEANCDVLALDYGLAPEHAFPHQVHEGVSLYKWLLDAGHDARDIAVVGDSAGGGLVLSVMLVLRDAGVPLPACAALASALTDLTLSGESIDWVTTDPCVTREGLEACREQYLQGADPGAPLASPLLADLAGFPPLLIQVGSREQLLSDSTRLAARADAAGVPVKLEVYDGCVHLWHWWVPEAPEAAAAVESIAEWVATHTRVSAPAPPSD